MLSQFDDNKEGFLDFQAFLNMCEREAFSKDEQKNEILRIFSEYDKGHKGFLTIGDFRAVSQEIGEQMEDETLDDIIKSIDTNNDGKITYEDFYNALTKKIF